MRNENKGYFEIMSTLFIMVVTFIIFIVAGEINEQYRVPYTVSMLVLLFIGASFTLTDIFNRSKYEQEKRPDKEIYGVELSAWATSTMDTIIIISIYTLVLRTINYDLAITIFIGALVLIFFFIIFGFLEGRDPLSDHIKRSTIKHILCFLATFILIVLIIFIINYSIPNGAPNSMTYAVAIIMFCRLFPEYVLPPRTIQKDRKQTRKRSNNGKTEPKENSLFLVLLARDPHFSRRASKRL